MTTTGIAQPVLSALRLSKRYRRRQVVQEVCFEVGAGEIVGLLGPNGAGKTTSFNMVAGLIQSDAGQVQLGGVDLAGLPLWRRVRAGLGYLPQESTVLRGLSCRHNLWVALEAQGIFGVQRDRRTQEALRRYRLEHVAEVDGAQLSGGERRRLELARALLREPRVLLLDEPFAGVDPIAVADIKEAIRQVQSHDIGVLVTDHNVTETLRLCDRAYLIYDGRIVVTGSPEEIVAHPVAQRVYLGQDFRL